MLSGLLVGCVSFNNYDPWQMGDYEADGKELERFEELSSEYEHFVAFDSGEDARVMRGVTGTGTVEDGAYAFAHDADTEYAHFHIELGALRAHNGAPLERVAFLARTWNRGSGFVEVYPGGDIRGSGGNPISVDGAGGLLDGAWTLVEFVADGDTTLVTGHNYRRVMNRRLESLSIFCFHGAAVKIDYILFD
ncbi:MAG: hypothetical protein ACOC7V_14165 [Spirochaetota bacterium]